MEHLPDCPCVECSSPEPMSLRRPHVSLQPLAPPLPQESATMSQPESSPTGKPLLPPAVVPWLTAAVAVAIALEQTLPPNTMGARVASAVVGVAALLGLVSPGLRRKAE